MAVTRVSVLMPCAGLRAVVQQHFPSAHTHTRLIVLSDRQSFHINKRPFNARSQSRKTPLPSSCPSVCPHVSARLSMDGFPQNLVLGEFYDMSRKSKFGYNLTKTSVMLHEQLRTFNGCRQHKFAITAQLYHNTQYFSVAPSNVQLNNTPRRQCSASTQQQFLHNPATMLSYM